MTTKVEKRFLKAVRSSGLVGEADLERALKLQTFAADQGRQLAIDRILLKLEILDREQLLGLWRALRYYVWRKEDKLYVKVAVQSAIFPEDVGRSCLKEQKKAYKHDNELVRVNVIARRRGYLSAGEDKALVKALHEQNAELTLAPVDAEEAAEPYERRSTRAATEDDGEEWKAEARSRDLEDLRGKLDSEVHGISDEDLDALWDEADLSDVELDSQALEIARSPLLDDSELDIDDDLLV